MKETRAFPPPSDPLADRILATIRAGAGATLVDEEFEDLAQAVFERQFERNPIYWRFCEVRGATPATIRTWTDIPAVPTDAFKAAPLLCGEPGDAEVVFRTSGTTSGPERRGEHYLLDTRFYRAALTEGFRHALLPDLPRIRIVSLVPSLEDAPDSSLSFMLDEVLRVFGDEGSATVMTSSGIDRDRLDAALDGAVAGGTPILVAGTSFAFVHLLDRMRDEGRRVTLPEGSRVMDTGGFKGRAREVGRDELYSMIEDRLGVPFSRIVNEYGMTEMSSQFYDGIAGAAPGRHKRRVHRGPGWVRSAAVDPETLAPLPAGEIGILRHLDLANLDSVMALQTADLGRVSEAGVDLIGRHPGAAPRGCSIAMDELLRLANTRR